jgi:hypothetical protein
MGFQQRPHGLRGIYGDSSWLAFRPEPLSLRRAMSERQREKDKSRYENGEG